MRERESQKVSPTSMVMVPKAVGVRKAEALMYIPKDPVVRLSNLVLIRLFQLTTRGRALSAAEPKAMGPC
jgi:hypothetical protein